MRGWRCRGGRGQPRRRRQEKRVEANFTQATVWIEQKGKGYPDDNVNACMIQVGSSERQEGRRSSRCAHQLRRRRVEIVDIRTRWGRRSRGCRAFQSVRLGRWRGQKRQRERRGRGRKSEVGPYKPVGHHAKVRGEHDRCLETPKEVEDLHVGELEKEKK